MATQVITEVIDVKIDHLDSLKPTCTRVNLEKEQFVDYDQKGNTSRYLKFYTSLIGEDSPEIMDLTGNYIGESSKIYRYDWHFGLSCIPEQNKRVIWDWKSKLRDNNSVKLQLIFDSQIDKSGVFIDILCANLLCLNPSKNTASWFEKNREGFNNSLKTLANTTKDYSKIASDVFNVANVLTNFIASDDNGKNWYLYKFLDSERNNFAIEWHINKRVLEQYGPMLQGSLVVNFHGSRNQAQKLRLCIRPSISFNEKEELCYVSPYESIKHDHYIEINPK